MSNNNTHQTLEELHQEISKLDINDPEAKERVEQLIAEMEYQIANPDDNQRIDSLTEQINLSIEKFEIDHPQLTGILNRIMVALGNMGI